MKSRFDQIGFSQRIQLEWLEKTANMVIAGNDRASINEMLQSTLKDQVSKEGKAKRGNKEKIISILMKIWFEPPNELEMLKVQGLNLLEKVPKEQHLVIHWGMVTAVYPFWGKVANQVGRLLELQNHVSAKQVQRRIREKYGERETVSRAARRILRSYIDWNVLKDTQEKGVYKKGVEIDINNYHLLLWLVEAVLNSIPEKTMTLDAFFNDHSLFPLRIKSTSLNRIDSDTSNIEIMNQNVTETIVTLKNKY